MAEVYHHAFQLQSNDQRLHMKTACLLDWKLMMHFYHGIFGPHKILFWPVGNKSGVEAAACVKKTEPGISKQLKNDGCVRKIQTAQS